jgi:serine/threonine protein kinase
VDTLKKCGAIIKRRYQIEKMLGRGGYGITYLAVDIDLPSHPKCVVKQLSLQTNNLKILSLAREMFDREAKVLERLGEKHNQIPTLLAYFEENQEFYLVQEFVDGQDLSCEITPGNHFSDNQVIDLLRDILQVLDFVHQHGVIHRDIKPSNLVWRKSDNKIVMIDFGAVKEISTIEVGLEEKSTRIGTCGYMPIEQENGHPQQSSDIYAVGIIGIQALTGLHPSGLEKDSSGDFIWRKHAPSVSNGLAYILDTMVRQNCELRYQSAKEALIALSVANETILPIENKSTEHSILSNAISPASSPTFSQNPAFNSLKNSPRKYFIIVSLILCIPFIFSIFKFIKKTNLEAAQQSNQAKIDLKDVCKQDFIYKDTDEVKNKIPIRKIGLKYRDDYDGWPVFRWVCVYRSQKVQGSRFIPNELKPVGMDLDEYCAKKYPNDKIKASHHDYQDPESLYCTNPHP